MNASDDATITLKFPRHLKPDMHEFDANNPSDMAKAHKLIDIYIHGLDGTSHKPHPEATGAKLQTIVPDPVNPERLDLILKVPRLVNTVGSMDAGSVTFNLAADNQNPNAGARVEETLSSQTPAVPEGKRGWQYVMTRFDWMGGNATFTLLPPDLLNARRIMANALGHGKDPWSIEVKPGPTRTLDGKRMRGWIMHTDFTISADKTDAATQAAVDMGQDGWDARIDPKTSTITVTPGVPPRFLPVHPYPFDRLGKPDDYWQTPAGVLLPYHGGDPYEELNLDWKTSNFLLVGGEPGSGKSVFINSVLASVVAQGLQLAVIDTPNKATDYYWLRPWVTPGYWGCGSAIQAAGVLSRIATDISRTGGRGKAWMDNGFKNWADIPQWAKEKYPQMLVVIDEYSTLVDGAKTITHLPNPDKTFPSAFDAEVLRMVKQHIIDAMQTIVRTGRAQGIRLILISQTLNQQSGVGPVMRDLFGHRVAMGARPSQSLLNAVIKDPKNMQALPASAGEGRAAKGVARYESSGHAGRIFKTHWAGHDGVDDTVALARELVRVRPVPEEVDEGKFLAGLVPSADGTVDVETDRMLTKRIEMPVGDAWTMDPELEDAHTQSIQCHMSHDSGSPASEEDNAGPEPSKPKLRTERDENLMSAAALAKAMGSSQ